MLAQETAYTTYLAKRGISGPSRLSYLSYLQRVSELLGRDSAKPLVRSQAEVKEIVRELKGKVEPKTLLNYRTALHHYAAFIKNLERPSRASPEVFGKSLNAEWNVGALHPLYRIDGGWYHVLKRFPGAYFDANGYILFQTEEEYRGCRYLRLGKRAHVSGGISSIPGYVWMRGRKAPSKKFPQTQFRSVAQRDEEESLRQQAATIIRTRAIHNQLVNKFAAFCREKLKIEPEEDRFDVFLRLNGKRGLLIEAKSEFQGAAGRGQVRQAIGQLFDYRFTHWPGESAEIKLALLLTSSPDIELKNLMQSLSIGILWQTPDGFAASSDVRSFDSVFQTFLAF